VTHETVLMSVECALRFLAKRKFYGVSAHDLLPIEAEIHKIDAFDRAAPDQLVSQ